MTLWQARKLFDFRWSANPALRRKQKKVMRRVLNTGVKWRYMKLRLKGDRITVKFPNSCGPNISGKFVVASNTLMIKKDLVRWSENRAAEVALHELLHALDLLAFTAEDRTAVYKLFHNGQEPDGFNDPVRHWDWPNFGLMPYGDHGPEDDKRHQWFDGISYRQGVGEAFAEVGQRALLNLSGLPYDHDIDPAALLMLLKQRGFVAS